MLALEQDLECPSCTGAGTLEGARGIPMRCRCCGGDGRTEGDSSHSPSDDCWTPDLPERDGK